jgi:predicted acylesterase/phospholipase RssA
MTSREIARKNLGIQPENKIILSFDGGGMRGIFTVQLLKKLEEVAGSPVYEWADMVAGTSTGAIIASLIAYKKSASEIESIYESMVTRVFTKKGLLANRFYNPPAFDKKNYRNLVKSVFADNTLKQISANSNIDILVTSKDLAAGEETFFTCFNKGTEIKGTYQDVLIRGVLEATMSAPTYFCSFERFVDGGTTVYNNPVLAATMEAFFYDGKGKYVPNQTTVFSFGTASLFRFIKPEETHDPKGLDALFWLNYVMDESSKDASEMQVNFLRSNLLPELDFRRFQLSLDAKAISKLPNKSIAHIPNLEADWLHELDDEELSKIDMADVTKFPLMKVLGEAVAEYICSSESDNNFFKKDLVTKVDKKGALVTASGDRNSILKNLSNPTWIDQQPTC